jgi:tyrosinase
MILRTLAILAILVLAVLIPPQATHAGGGAPAGYFRKNVKDLTPQEKHDFIQAILKMKQVPSPWNPKLSYYDQFVWWHRNTFNCSVNAAHMVPAFLVWHREFLLLFERALREVSGNPAISLPYWDWSDPASTKAVFAPDFMGGNGVLSEKGAVTTGPFAKGKWRLNVVDPKANDPYGLHYLVRNFGSFTVAKKLPTRADVAQIFNTPKYDTSPFNPGSNPAVSFRNNLEGWRQRKGTSCIHGLEDPRPASAPKEALHNEVHLWVGGIINNPARPKTPITGTMTLNTSNNDPVFWLHHTNIDRLFWDWEQQHGEVYAPVSGLQYGLNLHDEMWPYRDIGIHATPATLLDIHALNYDYDQPSGALGRFNPDNVPASAFSSQLVGAGGTYSCHVQITG